MKFMPLKSTIPITMPHWRPGSGHDMLGAEAPQTRAHVAPCERASNTGTTTASANPGLESISRSPGIRRLLQPFPQAEKGSTVTDQQPSSLPVHGAPPDSKQQARQLRQLSRALSTSENCAAAQFYHSLAVMPGLCLNLLLPTTSIHSLPPNCADSLFISLSFGPVLVWFSTAHHSITPPLHHSPNPVRSRASAGAID
jgi:hypothetical protein